MDKISYNRTEQLRQIKDEILNGTHLPLYKERIKNKVFPVIGEGSHRAKIMFIGEAPGKNEVATREAEQQPSKAEQWSHGHSRMTATGKPFCGASGKILDQLLESVGIGRIEVYVTNIVKDRPPMNRDPLPNEIEAYAPYLDRQIEIIRPEIIATLGRFSMEYIMRRLGLESELKSISLMHGQVVSAKTSYGEVKIVPLYHPAVAVYNANMKEALIKDFMVLKQFK